MANGKTAKWVRKVRACARAVATKYLDADFKRALVEPAIYDRLNERYNAAGAGRAFDFLRITLYLDLIGDAVTFTCDQNPRAASLHNIMEILANEDTLAEIRQDYCKDPPSVWCGPIPNKELLEWIEKFKGEEEKQAEQKFFVEYTSLAEAVGALLATPLARRLRKARDKLIAHYELTAAGKEPKLVSTAELGLKWGDVEAYLDRAEPLVFGAELLVSSTDYALEAYKKGHREEAQRFWAASEASS